MLYPTAAFSRQGSAWFFTARAGLHMRNYVLDRTTAALPERHPSYAIPITSLDAGMVFEREVEVLQAIASGLQNKEIAERLEIAEHTVNSHIVHLMEKLGANDRIAAVMTALRRGIIRL